MMVQRRHCQAPFSGAQRQEKKEETLFYYGMAEHRYRLFREVKDSPLESWRYKKISGHGLREALLEQEGWI